MKGVISIVYQGCLLSVFEVINMYTPVADAGFIKGGFCNSIVREILGPCPLWPKTTPIFERFGEKLLVLPVNPFIFDRDLC